MFWPFSGYRLYLLLHYCDPDGGGHLNLRLDPGRWLEGRPLWEVRPWLRPAAASLRHGGRGRMQQVQRSQWVINWAINVDNNDDPWPGYIRGCAALVVIGLLFDFFGTFLTGLGLRSTDPNKKYKYYRVAIYALVVSRKIFLNCAEHYHYKLLLLVIALTLAAIIYPVQFSKDLANGRTIIKLQLDFRDDTNFMIISIVLLSSLNW